MIGPVVIDPRARAAYPWMSGIVFAVPGTVIQDEASGIALRVREDGGLEELLAPGHPKPGAAYDPTNARTEGA